MMREVCHSRIGKGLFHNSIVVQFRCQSCGNVGELKAFSNQNSPAKIECFMQLTFPNIEGGLFY